MNSFPQSINQKYGRRTKPENQDEGTRSEGLIPVSLYHHPGVDYQHFSDFSVRFSIYNKQIQKCAYFANGNTPVKYLKNCT